MRFSRSYGRATVRMLLLIPLWYFSGSCDFYNFTTPQPADQKDLGKVPSSLQGVWIDDNDFDQDVPYYSSDDIGEKTAYTNSAKANKVPDFSDDSVLYIADDHVIQYITVSHSRILKGAWPQKMANGELQQLPPGYTAMYWIHYDSLKKEINRTANYIIQANRLYEISHQIKLESASFFYEQEDTLFATRSDTIFLQLGPNVSLRRFDKNKYVLSVRNRQLTEDNNWWSLYVLEQIDKGLVYLCQPDTMLRKAPGYFFGWEDDRSSYFYFAASWNTLELQQFMANGYFKRVARLTKGNTVD